MFTFHMICFYKFMGIWYHITWLWYHAYILYAMYLWYHRHHVMVILYDIIVISDIICCYMISYYIIEIWNHIYIWNAIMISWSSCMMSYWHTWYHITWKLWYQGANRGYQGSRFSDTTSMWLSLWPTRELHWLKTCSSVCLREKLKCGGFSLSWSVVQWNAGILYFSSAFSIVVVTD
jgi:hypothetical protein